MRSIWVSTRSRWSITMPRFCQSRIERTRIDREEKLSALHDSAVAEVDADDLTRNARTHFDGAARFEAADIIVPQADLLLDRLGDGYGRHRRSLHVLGCSPLTLSTGCIECDDVVAIRG